MCINKVTNIRHSPQHWPLVEFTSPVVAALHSDLYLTNIKEFMWRLKLLVFINRSSRNNYVKWMNRTGTLAQNNRIKTKDKVYRKHAGGLGFWGFKWCLRDTVKAGCDGGGWVGFSRGHEQWEQKATVARPFLSFQLQTSTCTQTHACRLPIWPSGCCWCVTW